MEISQKLLQHNIKLEKERQLMVEMLKSKVQTGGHVMLQMFKSFGNGDFYSRQSECLSLS